MRVECAACGNFVDVDHVPNPCPRCGVLIEDLNPRVLVYRPGGFRLEKQPTGPLADGGGEAPIGSGPTTPNPYPIHRDPPPRARRTAQIAIAVVVCLLIAYVVVDYVRLKSVSLLTQSTASTQAGDAKSPVNTGTAPPIKPASPPSPTATPLSSNPTSAAPLEPDAQTPAPPDTSTPTVAAAAPPTPPLAAAVEPLELRPTPAPVEPDELTDEALHQSIRRGVDYLLEQFSEQGQLDPKDHSQDIVGGRHALAALALIHASQSTIDERLSMSSPFMTRLIEQLKGYDFESIHHQTYSRSIRLMALGLPNRQDDRRIMQEDLSYLLKAHFEGGYTYTIPPNHEANSNIGFDNSNSQYGALGAWAAADAGFNLPAKYWRDVQTHWTDTQGPGGGWSYSRGGTETLTMTSAGVTMLFVSHDQLITDRSLMLDQAPYSAALDKGLAWLAKGDNSITMPTDFPGYALYGLERAGLASGFKRFGRHDWFTANARQILKTQDELTGAWPAAGGGEVVETAFRLLFLARGRHPLVMNKLRFDGAWANRPRDVVRLAEFVYDSIERPVNWQVAALENDWSDWMDSPILYIASHDRVELTDEDVNKLRNFAQAGGLLFTHADADSHSFNQFAEELAKRLFPEYPMQDLPETHSIYSTLYPIRIKLPMKAVSNGARLLLIHSPTDLGAKWQFRRPDKAQPQFELGANIVVYATGKHPLRNRLDSAYLPEPKNAAVARIDVARLQHNGNWNPEPGAWERFPRWFKKATSIDLNLKMAEPTTLKKSIAPITHLTSTGELALTDEQLQGIRRYVESGGVLFADVTGGSKDTLEQLRAQLIRGIGDDASFKSLPDDHPLLNASGEGMINLGKPRLRVYAVGTLGSASGPTAELLEFGKGAIILSPIDTTSGLLGTTTWGIVGYDPQYAQGLMNNAILWAVTGRETEGAWTPLTTQPTAAPGELRAPPPR